MILENENREVFFNAISPLGEEPQHIHRLLSDYNMLREKYFSNLCLELLQKEYISSELFLTHSGTGALEMIALMLDIQEGDEIILPSYTFVSTANAFVSKGAIPVFIDIHPETLNIDETLVEKAITDRTKAIIAVHYAGHACNLSVLKSICERHDLYLIEDAAMGFGAKYEGKPLGTYGDFGMISFDVTKQISAVQGGLLLVNHPDFKKRAGTIYHIGTNREAFMNEKVPYYEWVDKGSKYQMNELNVAVLYENLQNAESVLNHRNALSKYYYQQLKPLAVQSVFRMMPENKVEENIHEFYLLLRNKGERMALADYLMNKGIEALFHYIPLHLSSYGRKHGRFIGDEITEQVSDVLLRLPLHTQMNNDDVDYVCKHIKLFFDEG